MYEDPELPDFDSMSQEELIEWLEELTKLRGDGGSAADDEPGERAENGGEPAPAGAVDAWSNWLDDAGSTTPVEHAVAGEDLTQGDDFHAADEDTPVGLAPVDERDSGPLDAEAMAWLAEISAAEIEEDLPDITDYQPPNPPPENLADLLAQGDQEDPLDWLDRLRGRAQTDPHPPTPFPIKREGEYADAGTFHYDERGHDFDDAFEDDERLNDLEDESLYTRRRDASPELPESLLGLDDRESEEYSTQSMAPVPDDVQRTKTNGSRQRAKQAAADEPVAAPTAGDRLTQAYLLQDQQSDLEAWYSSRLRAIASAAEGAGQAPTKPKAAAAVPPSKPPPPGLAAAINSARGKVEADELGAALSDYETLLRTNAGLEWVVSDMRGLIAREEFRQNPSVHRVLGDALMRQGHLNAALDTYKHALTLL
ncbi:MAG: hypothetical protein OXG85_02085 [Chloroflexi bacterium]|nr:hypothetical protein [Chloroflexota bacterium]